MALTLLAAPSTLGAQQAAPAYRGFELWLLEVVAQWPVAAVASAALCFLLATGLGVVRQLSTWSLTTMHPVLITDASGQQRQINIDVPPSAMTAMTENFVYIDRTTHPPSLRARRIRALAWLPLTPTALYAAAVAAAIATGKQGHILGAMFIFVFAAALLARWVVSRLVTRAVLPRP